MKRHFFLLSTLIFSILLFSCASYSILGFNHTGKQFQSLPETENVDIVSRAVPEYKVIPIGNVKVIGIVDNQGYDDLKKLSRNKGGNVIILVETGYTNTGYNYSLYEIPRKVDSTIK